MNESTNIATLLGGATVRVPTDQCPTTIAINCYNELRIDSVVDWIDPKTSIVGVTLPKAFLPELARLIKEFIDSDEFARTDDDYISARMRGEG